MSAIGNHIVPILAGMPSVTLTEVARIRIQTLSFFLMGFLVSAGMILWLWNYLQKDFPKLPRLTYPKALAMVTLWGLLFVVVLVMISGARELLTPGAWEKDGWTYVLKKPVINKDNDWQEEMMRYREFHRASSRVRRFQEQNNGQFPSVEEFDEIAHKALGIIYLPPLEDSEPTDIVLHSGRRVMLVNGMTTSYSNEQLQKRLKDQWRKRRNVPAEDKP